MALVYYRNEIYEKSTILKHLEEIIKREIFINTRVSYNKLLYNKITPHTYIYIYARM